MKPATRHMSRSRTITIADAGVCFTVTLERTLHALQGEAAEHYPRYGIMPQGGNARGLWPGQTAAPRVEVSNAPGKEPSQAPEQHMEVRLPAQHLPSQVMTPVVSHLSPCTRFHWSIQIPPLGGRTRVLPTVDRDLPCK